MVTREVLNKIPVAVPVPDMLEAVIAEIPEAVEAVLFVVTALVVELGTMVLTIDALLLLVENLDSSCMELAFVEPRLKLWTVCADVRDEELETGFSLMILILL